MNKLIEILSTPRANLSKTDQWTGFGLAVFLVITLWLRLTPDTVKGFIVMLLIALLAPLFFLLALRRSNVMEVRYLEEIGFTSECD